MLLSSGLPILICFATITFGVYFWVLKWMLLRESKKPPDYDLKLHKKTLNLMPYAALLHLLVGIYMYGSPFFSPTNADTLYDKINSNLRIAGVEEQLTSDPELQDILQRYYKSIALLLLLLLLILFLILKLIISPIFKFFRGCLRRCISSKNHS